MLCACVGASVVIHVDEDNRPKRICMMELVVVVFRFVFLLLLVILLLLLFLKLQEQGKRKGEKKMRRRFFAQQRREHAPFIIRFDEFRSATIEQTVKGIIDPDYNMYTYTNVCT